MEIDEHLKYTLYGFLLLCQCFYLLIEFPACNSTRAREPASPWSLGVSFHAFGNTNVSLTTLLSVAGTPDYFL
jgi:hypothetical protein